MLWHKRGVAERGRLTPVGAAARASARHALAFAVASLGAACVDDGGTTPSLETGVAQLVKSSGDGQAGYFGNPLPDPYIVVAVDDEGAPVGGAVVVWAVASGGGSVDPPQVVTDAAGFAAGTHTLGTTGTQSVTASAPGATPVTFASTGANPPTAVDVSVENNFFGPRDVIVQVGGTVTWTWSQGAVLHNVTYTSGPSPLPMSSDTRDSGTHSTTFTDAARYEYACTLHAGMEGTVTVVR